MIIISIYHHLLEQVDYRVIGADCCQNLQNSAFSNSKRVFRLNFSFFLLSFEGNHYILQDRPQNCFNMVRLYFQRFLSTNMCFVRFQAVYLHMFRWIYCILNQVFLSFIPVQNIYLIILLKNNFICNHSNFLILFFMKVDCQFYLPPIFRCFLNFSLQPYYFH